MKKKRYKLKDIPELLGNPIGRSRLVYGIWYRSWPVLFHLATLYRHTLVRNTRIVAVVGSFGKSTTTRSVLTALGRNINPLYDRNAWSSVARAVLRIRPCDRHAVIEAGIGSPGQMAPYARMIRPNVVVVTSIGSEHNRSLPTLEATREEKSEMVRALSESGIAILNGDDPNVLWMKSQTRARTITFGIDKSNDVFASGIHLDWPYGTGFRLHAGGETRDIRISLLGKHMVYSILAAIAVSLAEGLTLDQVIPKLEAMPPTPGRMQLIRLANGAFILRDDFKSPLETIEAALDVLSEIPAQRRIIILGDIEGPPERKNQIYRQVGERTGKIASCAIFIGGDSCRNYSRGAKRIGLPSEEVTHIPGNVLKAAELLRKEIRPGDVVLIKGRSTQRLDRVTLSLMGRTVRCGISYCNVKVRCEDCPMLERGWSGQKAMI